MENRPPPAPPEPPGAGPPDARVPFPPTRPPTHPLPPGPPWLAGMSGPGPVPLGASPRVRKGDVRAAALALLSRGPRNGYQVIQEITELSHGIWRPSPGSVYPALQQLEDEGLVRAVEDGGRRTYHLTGEGRAHVDSCAGSLAERWAALADSVSEEIVDLRSMLGQVGMAMRQVMEAGTPAQHRQARKILADTRRALYWLLAEDPQEDE